MIKLLVFCFNVRDCASVIHIVCQVKVRRVLGFGYKPMIEYLLNIESTGYPLKLEGYSLRDIAMIQRAAKRLGFIEYVKQ